MPRLNPPVSAFTRRYNCHTNPASRCKRFQRVIIPENHHLRLKINALNTGLLIYVHKTLYKKWPFFEGVKVCIRFKHALSSLPHTPRGMSSKTPCTLFILQNGKCRYFLYMPFFVQHAQFWITLPQS